MSNDNGIAELRDKIIKLIGDYADRAFSAQTFTPGDSIPPSGKVIGAKELQLMSEAVLDGWLTTGRFNREFERRLAGFLGRRYVLTVNSGSSANLLAFAALTSPMLKERAIKAGDEVITVAAGFPTTVNPILQYGCVPVFVDISLPSYNIDPALIEAAVSGKTKAIMLAHTLGIPFDVEAVKSICEKYGLWLIEDCCDALGSRWNDQLVGGFGHIGTLSFYPAHHITMGEGGAVFTDDPELRRLVESFRDWGRDCYCAPGKDNTCRKRFSRQYGDLPFGYDHKYVYSNLGFNLKITDMQAACALAQMDRLPDFIRMRRENYELLWQIFLGFEDYFILPQATAGSDPSWFGFPLTIRDGTGFERVDLLRYLDANGVGSRMIFAGNLVRQPYMHDRAYRISGGQAVTDKVMRDAFWIGLWPGLGSAHFEQVRACLSAFIAGKQRAGDQRA